MLTCKKCGLCCTEYPCAPRPDEVERIASFLGLTPRELFEKYMVVDYYMGEKDYCYYPCFMRKGDEPGTKVSFGWAYKIISCVFLTDEKLCKIHPARPIMARKSFCEDESDEYADWDSKKEIAQAWAGYFDECGKLLRFPGD